jgi:hypothetical protein
VPLLANGVNPAAAEGGAALVTSTSPAGAPGPDGAAPLVELREVTVLSGLQRPSAGELLVAGRPVRFRDPGQARAPGIATSWQDLAIAPLMGVWRIFFLGAAPTRGRWPGPAVGRRRPNRGAGGGLRDPQPAVRPPGGRPLPAVGRR